MDDRRSSTIIADGKVFCWSRLFDIVYLHALVIHPDDGSYQSIDNDSDDGDDDDVADDCCATVKRRLVNTLR